MGNANDLLGIGLYTPAEASRLLNLSRAKLRRWVGGYSYTYKGELRQAEPLWMLQLPRFDGQLGLGFLDLMQLRLVARLVLEGELSLQAVRLALLRAREIIRHDHPFPTARFRTDGRRIFLEVAEETNEPKLYDLARRQYAFHHIVEPSFKDVDLDGGEMVRWWPLGHNRRVVLDPRRSFGQPITSESGIPTATLAAVLAAEGSARAVTRWYPASEREVRDAAELEHQLAA